MKCRNIGPGRLFLEDDPAFLFVRGRDRQSLRSIIRVIGFRDKFFSDNACMPVFNRPVICDKQPFSTIISFRDEAGRDFLNN